MSKPASKGAARRRSWNKLLAEIRADEREVTPESMALWMSGKWCDPRPNANEGYLDALQTALEARDSTQLLRMLDGAMPLSERLLPLLAEVIRDAQLGLSGGRPAAFTLMTDESVRAGFERATVHWKMGVGEAHLYLAEVFNVSVDTVKRSLRRTKPLQDSRG